MESCCRNKLIIVFNKNGTLKKKAYVNLSLMSEH